MTDVGLTSQGTGKSQSLTKAAILPLALIALILLMVIPVHPLLLDLFFTLNIVVGLAILMASLNTHRPLDFSAFPTVPVSYTHLRAHET